jgi:hypothetical protein
MTNSLKAWLAATLLSFVLPGAGCSKGELSRGNDGGGDGPSTASTLNCSAASDCTRSEIDHEIRSSADCVCLLGCPFTIMNVETADRRRAQYQALCTPGKNAQGQPCPVDDCALPAPLACIGQVCVVESIPR